MVQNQESIHYRAASKATHSGVEVLRGNKDIPRIIIESIEFVENIVINGRPEKCAFVAHFKPNNGFAELPMIINQTNARRLTKLYPECEGYLARLKNIPVRLTAERCKDPNGGGETLGLRISQIPPASEEEMKKWLVDNGYSSKKVITEDKVQAIIEWATRNKLGIEQIEEKYRFESQKVKDAVLDAIVVKPQPDDLP